MTRRTLTLGLAALICSARLPAPARAAAGGGDLAAGTGPSGRTPERSTPPDYGSVDDLERDQETAFKFIPYSTSAVTALMIDYFTCEALRAGKESVCERINRAHPAGSGMPAPCSWFFHTGRALRWLMRPDADASPCRAWSLADDPDPEKAAQECAKDGPFYQNADPKGLCAMLREEDPRSYPGAAGKRRCALEYAHLLRDPARCPSEAEARAASAKGADACALQARLLKALAGDDPALVAGTLFAPLVSRQAHACEPLAERTLAAYRQAAGAHQEAQETERRRARLEAADRRRIEAEKSAATGQSAGPPEEPAPPDYGSVEELERNLETAFSFIPYSTSAVTARMVDYFVCAALRAGKESVCEPINRRARPADSDWPPPCKWLFHTGRALRWMMRPDADASPCLAWARLKGPDPDQIAAECAKDPRFYQNADPKGLCLSLNDDEEYPGAAGRRRCFLEHAHLLRDPARCPASTQAQTLSVQGAETCPLQARLLKALADDDPASVAGTPFAPLLSRDPDACEPLGAIAISAYREAALAHRREKEEAARREREAREQEAKARSRLQEDEPAPEYDSVESLARGGRAALDRLRRSTGAVSALVSAYFACEALRTGQEALCERIAPMDVWVYYANGTLGALCPRMFHAGRAHRWMMKPEPDAAPCVAWELLEIRANDPATLEQLADNCREDSRFARAADPKGFCETVRDEYPGPSGPERCFLEHVHLLRDPALCPPQAQAAALYAQCTDVCPTKARLLKALAEGDPAPAAGTVFASLVGDDPQACKPLAEAALAAYRKAARPETELQEPARAREGKTPARNAPW